LIQRLSHGYRRFAIERFARREFRLNGRSPYVSFTFDDFPRSALTHGGRILANYGVRGTYFVSFRLLERESVSGRIASLADLKTLVRDGHELGCHTFDHLDGSEVTATAFEQSIESNRAALARTAIDAQFRVFAYPLSGPSVGTKKIAGRHFAGCRGGGQSFNRDVVDLNLLKAYFVDQRSRDNLDEATQLIHSNAATNGWLIFATHDVAHNPSPYGCNEEYFEKIVQLALASGARVLPMTQVCRELGIVN